MCQCSDQPLVIPPSILSPSPEDALSASGPLHVLHSSPLTFPYSYFLKETFSKLLSQTVWVSPLTQADISPSCVLAPLCKSDFKNIVLF